jgi:hypothetical protein
MQRTSVLAINVPLLSFSAILDLFGHQLWTLAQVPPSTALQYTLTLTLTDQTTNR